MSQFYSAEFADYIVNQGIKKGYTNKKINEKILDYQELLGWHFDEDKEFFVKTVEVNNQMFLLINTDTKFNEAIQEDELIDIQLFYCEYDYDDNKEFTYTGHNHTTTLKNVKLGVLLVIEQFIEEFGTLKITNEEIFHYKECRNMVI